jgi:hypothetical protein
MSEFIHASASQADLQPSSAGEVVDLELTSDRRGVQIIHQDELHFKMRSVHGGGGHGTHVTESLAKQRCRRK